MTTVENRPDEAEQGDEALAERLARRDVRALELLYDRHARAVYSLALKMLADPPAAEEIVQESFLKLWRQPELYEARRGKLLPWLLGVAHHRCVDRLRRRRLERRYSIDGEIDVPAGGDADPERRVWGQLRSEAVARALATLPATQRQALELAYLRGMTQAEIAASLYVTCGALRLARFNVQIASVEKRHFIGLPIPAAADVVAATVLMYFYMGGQGETTKRILMLLVVFAVLGGIRRTGWRW